MKYTFQCPACSHIVEVEAVDDEDAVNKIMAAGSEHSEEAHPDMKTDPEEMINLVKKNMKTAGS